ncbi:hypothetical protein F0365_10265 [Nonlabens sp. Ci31]|jgi:hypothetical protein|uniref:hypothetical protein n=1 Tax=Nonlabens sp. Ci31 TaxID=2608253 RepID=UPI00146475CA|nr:hypothetical protein [Nonlabens sp. Ci31]QJP34748.1 hypothetical protein F0365_10265 [Nonlabens sp. Ci31]
MLKNLDTIHKDLFKDLEKSVVEHEKLLSRIDKGKNGVSDATSREQHHYILLKMETLTTNF